MNFMKRAHDFPDLRIGRFYIGCIVYPYQLCLGLTLRFLDGAHTRIYIGPLKIRAGYTMPRDNQ